MSRVGFVGARSYKNKDLVHNYINELDRDVVVVSGGAYGVDSWSISRANFRGLSTKVYLPKLKYEMNYHERCDAYYRRNGLIVEDSDRIVAFINSSRGGTWNTINQARESGKPVTIVTELGIVTEVA